MAGIYQSRVFSFIGGHTNKVKNGLAQSWRQVKISVQWTGQILLAPVRWWQRFSQNPDRQMTGSDRSQLPMGKDSPPADPVATVPQSPAETAKLNASSANKALENLLAEVVAAGHGLLPASASALSTYEDWSVIDEHDWDTSLLDESNLSLAGTSAPLAPPRPVIQGLATLLSNGNLVLIDQYNQVLDVLSPSQQLHLRQQIDPFSTRALNPSAPRLSEQTVPSLEQTITAADLPPTRPEMVVLPPSNEVPQTLWQKINYWGKFYLEYLRVDTGAPAPSSPQRMLPSTLKLPFPLQKSVAAIPKSIDALTPLTHQTQAHPTQIIQTKSGKAADTDTDTNSNLPIDMAGQMKTTKAQTQRQDRSQVTFQPQWIEAPTENLGYERSLWRQLWEWLDRLMLAIENWIIRIYQQFKRAD